MYISWRQRTPDSSAHSNNDAFEGRQIEQVFFLDEWKKWQKEFPGQWKLVTLTGAFCPNANVFQLRLWFGEPASIRSDFVDSCGHNLAIHIEDVGRQRLLHVVEMLLVGHTTERTVESGTEVWRLKDAG